jgi:hypothetical protein
MNPYLWPLIVFSSTLLLVLVWLFFFVHAMQRIDDPFKRTEWLLVFLFFTIFAVIPYFFIEYRKAYTFGNGGILQKSKSKP